MLVPFKEKKLLGVPFVLSTNHIVAPFCKCWVTTILLHFFSMKHVEMSLMKCSKETKLAV